jgi:outer membrane protein TolC
MGSERVTGLAVRLLASVALGLLTLAPAPARAQMLTLGEVLASARDHMPAVLEATAKLQAAEGRRLAADGAFDLVFKGDAAGRLGGYYDGNAIGTGLTQPFRTMGGEVYAGYRLSDGRFPIYEDERYTNRLGELKVGVMFSLLRDRLIDERRFAVNQADVDIELARNEQLLVAIGVQRRALDAYGSWVVAGLRLSILRDLLELAETRQMGLKRQIEQGSKPAILMVENEQTILSRRSLVVQAEQALIVAATRLSLFVRDENGQPVVPPASRLPSNLPPAPSLSADVRALAAARPDLKIIDLRMQQARERLALVRNTGLPRLDLVFETSRDLGGVGEGGPTRSGTEPKIGLKFSVPIQQRAARGQLAAGEADLKAQALRRRQLEEQISIELETIRADIDGTRKLAELAQAEQARASDLASAERRRFDLRASDLFLVQVREEAEASTRLRVIDALWREIQARAELAAAAADLPALGL